MQLTVVDAFTDVPFHGNPAAVCRLSEPAPEDWMQLVAREMNLSETAFLVPRPGGYDLRWFTPAVEVALCGHATLACAHALAESPVEFSTQSGILTAMRLEDGWLRLDFPATAPEPVEPPDGLLVALGCEARWLGKSRFDYFVEVESEAVVRALNPDHSALQKLPVRGVTVTAAGSGRFDFVSRFFAPGSGIAEDPVTGSAHCALAPFWAARLEKTRMLAYQASPRGGVVRVEARGERVFLEGQAVTVSRVELLHAPIAR